MLRVRDFLVDQTVSRATGAPDRPLFSIILPTYCRCQSGQLGRAIDSVLRQTYRDFELIVVDDGSTDGSAECIRAAQARDHRVVHVRHERNSGLPALRVNEGIELARGQTLGFQFDDDAWQPHALETVAGHIKRSACSELIIGHAQYRSTAGEKTWVLPTVPVDLVSLHQQNLLANNAAFFPTEWVHRYGMYDCHLGMRRLCDWDLWLRYIKQAPYAVLDEVISEVYEYNKGAVGVTVPWDLPLFHYLHGIPRDALLAPEHWRDYEVDSLRIGGVEIEKDFRRRVYEDHIVPYYLRVRHHFPQVEGFAGFLPPEPPWRTVLLTKNDYDPCLDVTLGHYDAPELAGSRYKLHYQPLSQVSPGWTAEADLLVLVRTVEERARSLLTDAISQGVPVALYLDDDLLHFHEFGSKFDYLAPGTPYHRNLGELMSGVDAVWATTPEIAASVAPYTPRCVPHSVTVPAAWLPAEPRRREAGQPLKIGYVGSGYRLEDFRQIWEALRRLSAEYGDRLTFEFWGLDVSSLPRLPSPVTHTPFTFSYAEYIDRLRQAHFDLLLTPLLDYPRPRLAKSTIKYCETAVAGALGLFSDVPPYSALPAGLTCFKAVNTPDAWHAALRQAVTMPVEHFDLMRQRCVAHVREEYTAEIQYTRHEAALRATEFHARTREQRANDGRPRVAYVFHSPYLGGAELQLWRRLYLARDRGIAPTVVLPAGLQDTEEARQLCVDLAARQIPVEFADYSCATTPGRAEDFTSQMQTEEARGVLQRHRPALVHTTTFNAAFARACEELNTPHVASLYQVPDTFSWEGPETAHCVVNHSDTIRYAKRWSQLLGSEPVCSRVGVPETLFNLGLNKRLGSLGDDEAAAPAAAIHLAAIGTIQPRKRQLETIEAVARLRREGLNLYLHLYGHDHFYPEYLRECRLRAAALGDRVTFHGFNSDVGDALRSADILVSFSGDESFPGAIGEAMAAGVFVVTTPVGGVPELIIDGVTGILCVDASEAALSTALHRALSLPPDARRRILAQAWRVARRELHPDRTARDLFAMYNRAIDLTRDAVPARPRVERAPTASEEAQFPIRVGVPRVGRRVKSGLYYDVKIDYPGWAGLAVCVAGADPRVSFKGTLQLTVFDACSVSGRAPLRTAQAQLDNLPSYAWAGFQFAPLPQSEGRRFRVEFSLAAGDAATADNLCLLEATDFRTSVLRRVYHKYLRFGRGGQLAYRLQLRSSA